MHRSVQLQQLDGVEEHQQCRFGWGLPRNDSCTMRGTDSSDTGVYWCRSERGGCSNAINITVNSRTPLPGCDSSCWNRNWSLNHFSVSDGVILESPPLPVTEGETVTLRCSYKEKRQPQSISKFSAAFFHNDVFIGNHSTGKMNFMVSKSDEGFYKCKHPTKGESLQSWLSVTVGVQPGNFTPTPGPPQALTVSTVFLVCTILLITLYTIMTVACISVHRQLAKARADAKRAADRQMAN
ncbi:low affinity immunoglobulin gamma Fc region receptor II-like isoform X1 [Echeneis naucrates]|uniref:low affinity immunoglobulin gamma Fc region receptor II-like isoform X1 n=1 Tax=Echeneis naucrates TaxID=173247 RepID=UPI0011138A24|nr:low affinity immunoglobulin gamma Fc region receptor II-like isoform X1 [Echeneis naucrates]XP_029381835.1 low affinity immunoglobulin gamma Fc region receptor II-like isoform X1 [Echeneis naucrates]XP_029381836.1 low affinity immunoglobulin gamma Fc region receptor II-like isoform X1 [Echeneis naucrates]XP_029381837.1 low affinity immunoglobulin gamma Fc region receptor II-like isoform X1 [Echeneis naucrates]